MIVPSGMATSKRDSRRYKRAGDQRHDAEARILEQRRPLGVGEKIDHRDTCLKKFQDSKTRIPTMPTVMATETARTGTSRIR